MPKTWYSRLCWQKLLMFLTYLSGKTDPIQMKWARLSSCQLVSAWIFIGNSLFSEPFFISLRRSVIVEGSRSSTDAINESSSMLSLFEKAMSLIKDNRQSKTKAKRRSFSCVFITGGNSKPTKYNVSLYTGGMASRFSCENCPRTEIAALSLLTHWMLEECRSGHLFSQKTNCAAKKSVQHSFSSSSPSAISIINQTRTH